MQGKELAICRGHECKVCSVCVTADGKIISGLKIKLSVYGIWMVKNLWYAEVMNA